MNTIEEQLWNYIDGNGTPDERLEMEAKLAVDSQYQTLYQELLRVNAMLNGLELEEPSMSFTRNVMDQVKLELKPVALKTKVDNRIVYGIAAFFILALTVIFIYALATSEFNFKVNVTKIDVAKYITPTSLYVFLAVDVAIALIYFDGVIRKRNLYSTKRENNH